MAFQAFLNPDWLQTGIKGVYIPSVEDEPEDGNPSTCNACDTLADTISDLSNVLLKHYASDFKKSSTKALESAIRNLTKCLLHAHKLNESADHLEGRASSEDGPAGHEHGDGTTTKDQCEAVPVGVSDQESNVADVPPASLEGVEERIRILYARNNLFQSFMEGEETASPFVNPGTSPMPSVGDYLSRRLLSGTRTQPGTTCTNTLAGEQTTYAAESDCQRTSSEDDDLYEAFLASYSERPPAGRSSEEATPSERSVVNDVAAEKSESDESTWERL